MQWHPKHWSLASKWSVVLTGLALGPLLATISFSYQAASRELVGQAVTTLQQGAAEGAVSLDDAFAERVQQAKFLAGLRSVRDLAAAPPAARAPFVTNVLLDVRALQPAYPALLALDVFDAKGAVIYSSAGNKEAVDPKMAAATAGGQAYVGGLQPVAGRAEPVLVIAVPAPNGGVLRTEIAPDFLHQRVGRRPNSFLVDQEGKVIASSGSVTPGEALQLDQTGRVATPDGESLYAQSTTLGALPWKYVVAVPEADLAAALNAQKTRALLLALGASAIIGAFARLLARGFTRPLSKMAEATRALAAGDLTHEVKPTPRLDEVGQLQNAFAEAYSQLRRLAARMRLSSILVAEAAGHMHIMATDRDTTLQPIATASQKLSMVAQDLDRQVSHFKV
jgi:HAMP domain-containing protein